MNSTPPQFNKHLLTLFTLFFISLIFIQCQTVNENIEDPRNIIKASNSNSAINKQKGVHVFGHLDSLNIQAFAQNNYSWITLVPYGSQKDYDSPRVIYLRGDSLANLRRDSAWKAQIAVAHSAGFKVFLKPHIWMHQPTNGKWRSDIFPTNENNWQMWKKNYRAFILRYAQIAQERNVELFCIGTEFSRLSVEKAAFWRSLIKDVRNIYSGEITYAANWYNEYEEITFWDELDYIGIQAYFPLAKNNNPSTAQISKGWNKYFPKIATISNQFNRKILFTEMGYKSTADSAIEPWKWIAYSPGANAPLSYETQANCYQSFFDSVWNKEWLAGVHIWQMRCDVKAGGNKDNPDFTPQGKPAEKIIAKGFE